MDIGLFVAGIAIPEFISFVKGTLSQPSNFPSSELSGPFGINEVCIVNLVNLLIKNFARSWLDLGLSLNTIVRESIAGVLSMDTDMCNTLLSIPKTEVPKPMYDILADGIAMVDKDCSDKVKSIRWLARFMLCGVINGGCTVTMELRDFFAQIRSHLLVMTHKFNADDITGFIERLNIYVEYHALDGVEIVRDISAVYGSSRDIFPLLSPASRQFFVPNNMDTIRSNYPIVGEAYESLLRHVIVGKCAVDSF